MIIWTRWGIVVVLIAFSCFVATEALVESLSQDDQYYQQHGLPKAIASWITATILWPLGCWMNQSKERTLVDVETEEVLRFQTGGGHALFFIPVQYWGIIFAVIGVVLLFTSQQV